MIKPLNGNVVLDWKKEEETVSASGIILANTAGKRGDVAEVIAVSDGSKLEVGDEVLFNKLAGKFAIVGKKEVLVIPETEILAVFE